MKIKNCLKRKTIIISFFVLSFIGIFIINNFNINKEETVENKINSFLDLENLSHTEVSGEPYEYILSEDMINMFPQKWRLQGINANKYLDKKITEYMYSGHGLVYQNKQYDNINYLFIFCDNKLISGIITFSSTTEDYILSLDHQKISLS